MRQLLRSVDRKELEGLQVSVMTGFLKEESVNQLHDLYQKIQDMEFLDYMRAIIINDIASNFSVEIYAAELTRILREHLPYDVTYSLMESLNDAEEVDRTYLCVDATVQVVLVDVSEACQNDYYGMRENITEDVFRMIETK